jgi:hypothetical protein
MIKVTLMLCDFVQIAEGKLFINGGGWSIANRLRGYMAGTLEFPIDYAQRKVRGRFLLFTADGAPVEAVTAPGEQVKIAFEMELAPRQGLPRGMPLDGPFAAPLPDRDLPVGRYEWVLVIDGEEVDWRLQFSIAEARDGQLVFPDDVESRTDAGPSSAVQ